MKPELALLPELLCRHSDWLLFGGDSDLGREMVAVVELPELRSPELHAGHSQHLLQVGRVNFERNFKGDSRGCLEESRIKCLPGVHEALNLVPQLLHRRISNGAQEEAPVSLLQEPAQGWGTAGGSALV